MCGAFLGGVGWIGARTGVSHEISGFMISFEGLKKAADESEMAAGVDWKSCGRFAAGGR